MMKQTSIDIKPFIHYRKSINGFWCGVVQFADGYNFSYSSDEPMQKAKPQIARRLHYFIFEDDTRDLIKEHGQLIPWPKKKRSPKN